MVFADILELKSPVGTGVEETLTNSHGTMSCVGTKSNFGSYNFDLSICYGLDPASQAQITPLQVLDSDFPSASSPFF